MTDNPKDEMSDTDVAFAIGEHAFRAGFAAGWDSAMGASQRGEEFEQRWEDRAWSEYDPPEDIKALR